ncbi:MAG: hypothetical protein IJS65_06705 [Clostridia bacterium]|nr:hypothetical protein [Clostridia bacterium]
MLDTSGIDVTENDDGTVELFFCDFDVEMLGGSDYECTIKFDRENSEKFRNVLSKRYSGSLEEMVVAAFTSNFSVPVFEDFCKKNGIVFDRSVWW